MFSIYDFGMPSGYLAILLSNSYWILSGRKKEHMMKHVFATSPLPDTIDSSNPYIQQSVNPRKREPVLSEAFPIGDTFLLLFALMRKVDAL